MVEDFYRIQDFCFKLLKRPNKISDLDGGWGLLHCCVYMFSHAQNLSEKELQLFLDLIKHLIDNGEDINKKDNYGRTPIYFASTLGGEFHQTINEKFSEILGIDERLFNPDNQDVQPLHTLVSLKGKCVRFLIEMGAKTDVVDKFGRMPLHCAVIKYGRLDFKDFKDLGELQKELEENFSNVKALVDYEPKSLEHQDSFGNFPLYYAFIFGKLDVLTFLLENSSLNVISLVLQKLKTDNFLSIDEPSDGLTEDSTKNEQLSLDRLYVYNSLERMDFSTDELNFLSSNELSCFKHQFSIYDPIYCLPKNFELEKWICKGGGEKHSQKKQRNSLLKQAVNNKKKSYQDYDTYHDGHGWKHVINANVYKQKYKNEKQFEADTLSKPAKFFPDFGKDYVNHIEVCVKKWVDKGADRSQPYVNFPNEVGADNGNLTKTVEIYFTDSGGVHIRPKYLDYSL